MHREGYSDPRRTNDVAAGARGPGRGVGRFTVLACASIVLVEASACAGIRIGEAPIGKVGRAAPSRVIGRVPSKGSRSGSDAGRDRPRGGEQKEQPKGNGGPPPPEPIVDKVPSFPVLTTCRCEERAAIPKPKYAWQQQGPELFNVSVCDAGSEAKRGLPSSFSLDGMVTADGAQILKARVEKGRLAGEKSPGKQLTKAQWAGVRLKARLECDSFPPSEQGGQSRTELSTTARITEVRPDGKDRDTSLYRVELQDPQTGAWAPICKSTKEGEVLSIPLAGVWGEQGDVHDEPTSFTFACTTSVIAKCYRWGYRPWDLADARKPKLMADLHQACTRMARADYFGIGEPNTEDGTEINLWDSEGQVKRGRPRKGFTFESAWTPEGAVCMNHPRRDNGDVQSENRSTLKLAPCGSPESVAARVDPGTPLVFVESRPPRR